MLSAGWLLVWGLGFCWRWRLGVVVAGRSAAVFARAGRRRRLARWGAVALAAVAAAAVFPAVASADGFPVGSLALGHPALHREQQAVAGAVRSFVAPPGRAVAGELLVGYRRGVGRRARAVIRARAGVRLVGSLLDLPVELVSVARARRRRAIARLRRERGVHSVQPDSIDRADSVDCSGGSQCLVPNDPGFWRQWYLYNSAETVQPPGSGAPVYGAAVDAPLAWDRTLGSAAVRIAIIDSGIDAAHPDLAGKVVAAANFTASDSVGDASGHGTHVAGIAAAAFDNGVGIAGMAPSARLMDVKVLAVDASGNTTGDCADVADGIVWAADHGANVLNLSLGSPSPCEAMALAIDYAFSRGALVVAAAGNDAATSRFYPAAYDHVVSVAATDNRDQLAGFSNRGAGWVDVAAPGAGIVSTLPTSDNGSGAIGYGYMSGTSMAAPVVSGIAALIWGQMPPGQVNQEVRDQLFSSAEPITGTGTDWRYGMVDACLAVTGAQADCAPPPPTPTPSVQPPAPPPPTTARPVPITAPAPAAPRAKPGSYRGLLGRRRTALRLVVGASGDALIRVQTVVGLRCRHGPVRAVRLARLSTTDYGKINRAGVFRLVLRGATRLVRAQRIVLTGRFYPRLRQATGSLRITGRARAPAGRCDSGTLWWSARLVGR
jgi:thermitase